LAAWPERCRRSKFEIALVAKRVGLTQPDPGQPVTEGAAQQLLGILSLIRYPRREVRGLWRVRDGEGRSRCPRDGLPRYPCYRSRLSILSRLELPFCEVGRSACMAIRWSGLIGTEMPVHGPVDRTGTATRRSRGKSRSGDSPCGWRYWPAMTRSQSGQPPGEYHRLADILSSVRRRVGASKGGDSLTNPDRRDSTRERTKTRKDCG